MFSCSRLAVVMRAVICSLSLSCSSRTRVKRFLYVRMPHTNCQQRRTYHIVHTCHMCDCASVRVVCVNIMKYSTEDALPFSRQQQQQKKKTKLNIFTCAWWCGRNWRIPPSGYWNGTGREAKSLNSLSLCVLLVSSYFQCLQQKNNKILPFCSVMEGTMEMKKNCRQCQITHTHFEPLGRAHFVVFPMPRLSCSLPHALSLSLSSTSSRSKIHAYDASSHFCFFHALTHFIEVIEAINYTYIEAPATCTLSDLVVFLLLLLWAVYILYMHYTKYVRVYALFICAPSAVYIFLFFHFLLLVPLVIVALSLPLFLFLTSVSLSADFLVSHVNFRCMYIYIVCWMFKVLRPPKKFMLHILTLDA